VDERRRLQRVVRALMSKIGSRRSPELLVDDRQELVAGLRVTTPPRFEQSAGVSRWLALLASLHGAHIATIHRLFGESTAPMTQFRHGFRVTPSACHMPAARGGRIGRICRSMAWCALVALGLGGSNVSAREEATPADITVIVTDLATVGPGTFDRAQVEASRIYRRLGVKMIWRNAASPDENTKPGPAIDSAFTIKLIIQPRLVQDAGRGPRGSRTIMAAAPPSQSDREGSVYVFYDRVIDVARLHDTEAGLLMGIVIAHEIGHGAILVTPPTV
jgi:hypothetical protein